MQLLTAERESWEDGRACTREIGHTNKDDGSLLCCPQSPCDGAEGEEARCGG